MEDVDAPPLPPKDPHLIRDQIAPGPESSRTPKRGGPRRPARVRPDLPGAGGDPDTEFRWSSRPAPESAKENTFLSIYTLHGG